MIADPRAIPCIDLGHLHVFSTVTFADWLLFLAPQHALHFHFHDNDGGEDGHLPLGRGTIDWPGVRRLLERLQVPFSVGLEPHNGADLRRMLSAYRRFFLARKRATAGDAARRPAARTRGSHR
jgi:sugar phosphate isomerase/epimerase